MEESDTEEEEVEEEYKEKDDDQTIPAPTETTAPDTQAPEDAPPPRDCLSICEDCGFAFCKVCHSTWHGDLMQCRDKSELQAE